MTAIDHAVMPETVFRRRPRPDVEWVEVAGEIVAWHQESESLHLLDPIAALVFQLMDGSASLRATIEDLADAFGRPAADIGPDVLTCAASLESLGIVERLH